MIAVVLLLLKGMKIFAQQSPEISISACALWDANFLNGQGLKITHFGEKLQKCQLCGGHGWTEVV